jgi:hypothetical protein
VTTKAIALLTAALLLAAEPSAAAEREVISTDWTGFQKQVIARKFKDRSVLVGLTSGEEVKTTLEGLTDSGLVTKAKREIPKDQIRFVRISGKTGKGGLIGGMAGLGAGAAIGAAIATSSDVTEGVGVILIPIGAASIAAIGGIAGYLIGRSSNRPAPEFVITR